MVLPIVAWTVGGAPISPFHGRPQYLEFVMVSADRSAFSFRIGSDHTMAQPAWDVRVPCKRQPHERDRGRAGRQLGRTVAASGPRSSDDLQHRVELTAFECGDRGRGLAFGVEHVNATEADLVPCK